jgi:hypothetical protein
MYQPVVQVVILKVVPVAVRKLEIGKKIISSGKKEKRRMKKTVKLSNSAYRYIFKN